MRIIIAGGGQVGALIARRLVHEGNEVVIVEPNANRCHELDESLDAKVVQGSAARVETLRQAGISHTDMLITVTNSDEINVLACLIAQAEPSVRIKVARIRTHEVDAWRRLTTEVGPHIDHIIHPETDMVERVMRVLHLPGVSDLIDLAEGRVQLFGMNLETESWQTGKTLEDLQAAGPPADSLIPMIFRGQQVIIPHGAVRLEAGDHVYTLGTRQNLNDVLDFMGIHRQEKLSRVFIIGGKQVGITIAEELEAKGVHVKLFERDAARCERIAEIVKKTIVIHGDGTDQATLEEESVEGIDAFLAMTNEDEVNLIASMLARRVGVKKVVALINKLNYLPMAQRLGVNTTVSPRLAAVDRILRYVRRGRVQSVTTFREEEAEAIELIAAEGRKYVGKKLREISFPRGAIVGAIVKPDGTVQIPRGDGTIEAGDRVIFFALERVVPELESAFLLKPHSRP